MSSKINAGLLLYRYQKEELEVYLVPSTNNDWQVPESATVESTETLEVVRHHFEALTGLRLNKEDMISLDLVECMKTGKQFMAYALETDWEKLPPNSKRRRLLTANKGAYLAMKDAFKKVMPAQYALLKELQEVLSVRNLIRYL